MEPLRARPSGESVVLVSSPMCEGEDGDNSERGSIDVLSLSGGVTMQPSLIESFDISTLFPESIQRART